MSGHLTHKLTTKVVMVYAQYNPVLNCGLNRRLATLQNYLLPCRPLITNIPIANSLFLVLLLYIENDSNVFAIFK